MRRREVNVTVASFEEASEILESADDCTSLACLISIGEEGDRIPDGFANVDTRLRLTFPDTTDEYGPTEADVEKIIAVARRVVRSGGSVLAHCAAGVSRSSAAALIVYAVALGSGREEEALRRVCEQRPVARPNRRMIEIADRLLRRKGNLLSVLGGATSPIPPSSSRRS